MHFFFLIRIILIFGHNVVSKGLLLCQCKCVCVFGVAGVRAAAPALADMCCLSMVARGGHL